MARTLPRMRLETPKPSPRIALSDDGETLAVEAGTTVKLWSKGTATSIRSAKHIGSLALSPDGAELFVGERTLALVDAASRTSKWTLKTKDGADPVTFATAGGAVFLREVGKKLRRIEHAHGTETASTSIQSVREGYFGKILSLGLSRSGAVLGSVVQRRRAFDLVRWRADTLEVIDVRETLWAQVSGRGGGAILKSGTGHLWLDLDDPDRVRPFQGIEIADPISQVCIDPTGRYVGFLEGLPIDPWMPMSIWDTVDDREIARLDDEERGQAKLLGPGAAFAIVHAGDAVLRLDL